MKPITPEMIAAWRTLQDAAATHRVSEGVVRAINTIDDSDFMVPIEDAGICGDQSAGLPEPPCDLDKPCPVHDAGLGQTYDTPRCKHCSDPLNEKGGDLITGETFCGANPGNDQHEPETPLDPAEWGDTTRADMARHQKEG